MKRIITFILFTLLLSVSAFPQAGKKVIRLSGSSADYADTNKVRQISSRTTADSIANMKAGVFNVLDDGAELTAIVPDAI